MKLAVVTGWILFALEVLVAAGFLFRRSGSDATGNAIARDLGLVLIPLLVVVGGLFLWGQRGGPRSAFWIGWTILCLPLIVAAYGTLTGGVRGIVRGIGTAAVARFGDARLDDLSEAIERSDTAKVERIVAGAGLDWRRRNGYGKTVLALAVARACDFNAPPEALAILRALLAAGAYPKGTNASDTTLGEGNDADELVLAAFGQSNGRPNAVAVLDLLLAAGGSANARFPDGQPMYFSTYRTVEAMEVLAKHGADFTAKDTSYESRRTQSPAAWAMSEGDFDHALFLLEHGVSPDQDESGGTSARGMRMTLESGHATDPRFRRLMRVIDATPHGGFVRREQGRADSVGT